MIHMLMTMFLAMIPVFEQKAAIPLGLSYGLGYPLTYLLTLIGTMIPVPFILFLMPKVLQFMKKHKILLGFVNWYEKRSLRKGKSIANYQYLGLFIFVAIPLPMTGVWTGTSAAALLNLEPKKSLIAVFCGAIISGLLILFASMGVINIFFV